MSTKTYNVLQFMADIYTKKVQNFQCVPQCLELIILKKIHTEGACVTRDINYRISRKCIYTGDTKTAISSSRPVTVAKNSTMYLSAGENSTMCCVGVIMKSG